MKRIVFFLIIMSLILPILGCVKEDQVQIVATTLPVYSFTAALCEDTSLRVKQLITEEVSCLHDYTLQVNQTKALEQAEVVILSGAGLEDFLPDIDDRKIVDASNNIPLYCTQTDTDHEHEHGHGKDDTHSHSEDPHIWLSVENAQIMCDNIYAGLIQKYPEYKDSISNNYASLSLRLTELRKYAHEQLSKISHREIITFHDGFHYLAESLDLKILHAIEEESGSEASANELKQMITMVREHKIPSIFTESSGSTSAAEIISRETGVPIYTLDMGMSQRNYFDAMYHNINTLKEALE